MPPDTFFQRVLEASGDPVLVFGCDCGRQIVLYVNPAFERRFGCTARDALGRDWRYLAGAPCDEIEAERLRNATAARRETCVVLRGGSPRNPLWHEIHLTPLPGQTRFVGVIRDVTAGRRELEQLKHRAFHDPLTELPNRLLFQDRLDRAIAHARSRGHELALLFLDLVEFKQINDRFGHSAGDELLKQVGMRLSGAIRVSDTVARIGGDEFVVLLEPIDSGSAVQEMVRRIVAGFEHPMHVAERNFVIDCSVGIARFPHDGADCARLLEHADREMYRDKSRIAVHHAAV